LLSIPKNRKTMKSLIMAGLGLLITIAALAQVPQGFNYQAVIRDNDGKPIANQAVKLRVKIQNDAGTVLYSEVHQKTTSPQGVIDLTVGSGSDIGGTPGIFKDIPWGGGNTFIKIEIDPAGGNNFTSMGDPVKLQSVPYALYAESGKEIASAPNAQDDEPIFVVRNKAGQIVFAVYQTGVRIYVEDSDQQKGARGGFAVGGLTNKEKEAVEFLRITSDSARINVRPGTPGKGTRSGFAVGGLTNKASQDLMFIAPDSARIWVNSASAKGTRGGFAVGGLTNKGDASNFIMLTPENYLIGHQAGFRLTEGKYNSFFGYQSGYNNTLGSKNVFLGRFTGYSNSHGISNIFIGDSTGYKNTLGSWNVFLGSQSGYSNTLGVSNVFLGLNTGFSNDTGSYNVFIGTNSGRSNINGNQNVFLGQQSGYHNTDGNYNVFAGCLAGNSNTTGKSNVFIGNSAGYTNTTGNFNTFIGTLAGAYNTEGYQNSMFGQEAGYSNTTGKFNAFFGIGAGYSNTEGEQNTFLGQRAGYSNTTGGWNVCIGSRSGYSLKDGQGNVMIGDWAGHDNSGSGNVFIGSQAGQYETGSDKLYISNNNGNSQQALIYGDFSAALLRFNANVGINAQPTSDKLYVYDNRSDAENEPALRAVRNSNTNGFGIGVVGIGSRTGVHGVANIDGTGDRYGLYGYARGSSTYNIGVFGGAESAGSMNVGVFGFASGASINLAGYFNGNVYVTGNLTQSSDETLKSNIRLITNSLDKIKMIRGVRFQWRGDLLSQENESADSKNGLDKLPRLNFPAGEQIGVLAQDVEKILPEIVFTGPDGLKSVDYTKLIPVLIEAIKEQQKQIDRLSLEIEQLKK
jgi:hypothetical protein